MKLTYEMLEKLGACQEGLEWYKSQEPKTVSTVKKTILLALKNKNWEIIQYANWGIVQFLTKEQRIEYSIYAAEKVLHIFEEKFPDDQQPRKAIQATKNYLINPTEENKLDAASAAASAASAASAAASAAADAAWAAVMTAASAAAWVAAWAAARATGEDNKTQTLTDIVKFGLKLLKN